MDICLKDYMKVYQNIIVFRLHFCAFKHPLLFQKYPLDASILGTNESHRKHSLVTSMCKRMKPLTLKFRLSGFIPGKSVIKICSRMWSENPMAWSNLLLIVYNTWQGVVQVGLVPPPVSFWKTMNAKCVFNTQGLQ